MYKKRKDTHNDLSLARRDISRIGDLIQRNVPSTEQRALRMHINCYYFLQCCSEKCFVPDCRAEADAINWLRCVCFLAAWIENARSDVKRAR
jgi:hypothetical protein